MARLNHLVIFALLSLVTLSHSRVIYKRYRKVVPPKRPHVKQVEEIFEVFHTHQRPPMYGHSEAFINGFLAHDYDPKKFKTHGGKRPRPLQPTKPTETPVDKEMTSTTQKAIHPDVEVSVPNWDIEVETVGPDGWDDKTTSTRSWWDIVRDPTTTTEEATTTEETTTTEEATTTQAVVPPWIMVTSEPETTTNSTTTEEAQEDTDDSEYHYTDEGEASDEFYTENNEDDEKAEGSEEDLTYDDQNYENDQPSSTTEFNWWG
uniref:Putative peptidase m23 n=1 Tax=Phlebotomus kandelakii TaxID=1109342 RepID=A0A6B2EFD0_9DIPT